MRGYVHRRSIVVGVDGSQTSFRAAQWAAYIADQRRLPLLVVRALPAAIYFDHADEMPIGAAFREQSLAFANDLVAHTVRTLQRSHPGLDVSRHLCPGAGVDALLELSERASLIVVGATGRSRVGALLLGSTATQVANHAACPVAVWRGTMPVQQQLPVVVGVDGSATSELAIEQAFDFASMAGAGLVAVHTWFANELPYSATVTPEGDEERESALLAECLAGWGEKYPDVEVVRVCKQGNAGVELLERAKSAQLVVVGSHGHHPLAGTLLGSTSQRMLHRAPCPVLICRSETHE